MSRGKAVGISILTVPLLGAVLFIGHRFTTAQDSSTPDPVKQQSIRVRVINPQTGGMERTVTRPGAIHAFQYADLYAKVSGFLRHQKVDIGSPITADEVLVDVYAPEYAAAVRQAKADVAKAEAQVGVMQARLKSSQADLKEARVKVEQAQADVESAVAMTKLRGEQYRRYYALARRQAIEQELVDERQEAKLAAEATERAKRKAVETAKSAVAAAEAHVTAATADVADARAQVEVANAALVRAQVFESYTRILAPFTGVVTRRYFHEGDYIREGGAGQPILTVARTDTMRVIVYVPDPDVPLTHDGQQADITITSLPGETFHGKVARTAVSEDYSSRTMRTEIDLPNPTGELKNGMFGSVTIRLGADPKHLTIPSDCLQGAEKDGHRFVYVVKDGKAHRVAVQVVQDNGVHAEIASGLRPDDRVIENHGSGLIDGVAVTVTNAAR